MFSTVFYSKTIGKQKKLSHYVNPDDSRSGTWHNAFSYIVDRNCKVSLETYFAFLNLKTRRPTKVVDLTVNSMCFIICSHNDFSSESVLLNS